MRWGIWVVVVPPSFLWPENRLIPPADCLEDYASVLHALTTLSRFPVFFVSCYMSWADNMPMFPGEKLNLHLFEPRYKLMIQRIVNTSRRFVCVRVQKVAMRYHFLWWIHRALPGICFGSCVVFTYTLTYSMRNHHSLHLTGLCRSALWSTAFSIRDFAQRLNNKSDRTCVRPSWYCGLYLNKHRVSA